MKSLKRLIDGVSGFSPDREAWVDKLQDDLPNKVTVHFKTGQMGYLDLKDPLSAHRARRIDQETRAGNPVYVEIDQESNVITNVRVPQLYKVDQIDTDDHGNLLVRLRPSSIIYLLLKSDPDFESMRDSLQKALADGTERLITDTRDDHEIIDVRKPEGNPGGSLGPDPPPPPTDPPVSEARAGELFTNMKDRSCSPCDPSIDLAGAECISFLYPDNGCWIRAHIMCHLMMDGVPDPSTSPHEDPEKVWIYFGSGSVPTANHPNCQVGWAWHVAPTLQVIQPGGNETWAFDPSISPIAEHKNDWRDRQNPGASMQEGPWTDWLDYGDGDGAGKDLAYSHSALQYYRGELFDRCEEIGPPPYSCTKNLFFIIDRNNISDDEVEAMLLGGSPAQISDAFYIVLDGFSPDELGFTSATMQYEPFLAISPGLSGMTFTADRIEFEYPNFLNRRQRMTWVYHIEFTDISDFTGSRRTITVEATMETESAVGTFYLIQQANPYEIDGPVSWLSADLRVFQIKANETRFGVTMGSNPNDFITEVITKLNDNTAGQTFDSISTDQQTSRLELSGAVDGDAVYNFAIAKVRYRSTVSDAENVCVLFRLFPWATTSVEYNQETGYRRYVDGDRVIPLLGNKNDEVTSIPCFAAPRIDSALYSMTTQPDDPNVQTISKDTSGAEVDQHFGCYLDINQDQPQFPLQTTSANRDGPYTSGRQSIQDMIRGEHQCLVSEIAFLPAPAEASSTPSTSDKLAQRNLAIVESANPGLNQSRRIPQTFEVQPSGSPVDNDELMIDWGNVPVGSDATLYLPGFDSREVMKLASRKYRHHRFNRIDEHTVKFETGGITYLPIPFTDGAFPGLLTVDLPEGIKKGEAFKVVVRQVSGGIQRIRETSREEFVRTADWRHIVGSFQLTIPVRDKVTILPNQQRLLSNLRWIERAIPAENRWSSVFAKYVSQIADRVDALGGDSSKVAPSPTGQWQQAYRACHLFSLVSVLLIAALFVGIGTQTGLILLGAIPLGAVLAWVVSLWRKRCRPKYCQLLKALLAGSVIGAIILALLALFGVTAPRLVTTLVASACVSGATAIVGWVRGCFGR